MLPPERGQSDEERRHGQQLARLPNLSECRKIEEDWHSDEQEHSADFTSLEERVAPQGGEAQSRHPAEDRELPGVLEQLYRASPEPHGADRHLVGAKDVRVEYCR